MSYLLLTHQWRHLTRPQLADFKCPVTLFRKDNANYKSKGRI